MADNPHTSSDLELLLKRIYDHLYANATVRTPSAIAAEVSKLLRVALFIEKEAHEPVAFSMALEKRERVLRGDKAESSRVAAYVRARFEEMCTRWALCEMEGIVLSDVDIAWVWATLDGVVLSETGRDVLGDATEVFRTTWAKQSSGQFFTDSKITGLAMSLLRFDPLAGDDLVDICCGTGGFLLAALEVVGKAVDSTTPVPERTERLRTLALRCIRGQEIDQEIVDVAKASLQCRILGADQLVMRGDSLQPHMFRATGEGGLIEGAHRCAAANPPFGTKITVKSTEVLAGFDLARKQTGRPKPCPPDILLLERNVRMLQRGVGRLAIVLPYQILSGPQTRYVREWLLRHTHLETVVDLPPETFQPYTGTKTSLVVVRRREEPLPDVRTAEPRLVFMSTPKWIGHDRRGRPLFRRLADGVHQGEVLSDIEDVAAACKVYRSGGDPGEIHKQSFSVSLEDVTRDRELRLNARYHSEGIKLRKAFSTLRSTGTRPLRDVTERVFFPSRFKRHYVEEGDDAVPFLGGANVAQLIHRTDKWLSKGDPKLPDLFVHKGWLLVTRSGTTGVVSSVPPSWEGVAVSEHVIRIIPRPEELHPAWIQAYLRSHVGQRALSRGVFGSVIDEITPTFLEDLEIPLPRDRALYERVIESVVEAETARDRAISGLRRAIKDIDSIFDNL